MEAELGARIRALREAAGLRAADLADLISLDATAVSKIENGRRSVKSVELARIAQALRVSPLALLEPESLLGRLPVAARTAGASIEVGEAYDRLVGLSELHVVLSANGIHNSPRLSSVPSVVGMSWLEAAERLADWATEALPIGDAPEGRFAALVNQIEETLALDVLVEAYPGDPLSGAAITDSEFPLVFVNSIHPLPRSLFTLAHELGHVLARHNGGTITLDRSLASSSDEERTANAFAANFLMPAETVLNTIEEHGRQHPTLVLLASSLGVSFESLIYRLHNLRVIDARGRDQLMSVNWRQVVLGLSDPDKSGGLTRMQVAQFQARSVTPPPTTRPAMLIRRATSGFRKGVIGAQALGRLVGTEIEADTDQVLADFENDPDLKRAMELINPNYGPEAYEDDVERFSGTPL